MPLKWTKELPTEEGWYWYRCLGHGPAIHYFYKPDPQSPYASPTQFEYEQCIALERDPLPNEEWAGPIPLPES